MHSYQPNSRRGSSGFTLLELVIALAMVAMVVASLATTMQIAFRAQKSAETAIEPSRSAELAMEFLQTDVQSAVSPNPNANSTDSTTISGLGTQNQTNGSSQGLTGSFAGNFEGTQSTGDNGHEADDVIFFGSADGPYHVDANGDIKQIELTVQTINGDHCLVRRVTRNLLSEQTVNPDQEILCRGVNSFTVQYYTGSTWMSTWDSTQEDNTLPASVQIDLELQRPLTGPGQQIYKFSRIFNMPCSTAAQDSTVNTAQALP